MNKFLCVCLWGLIIMSAKGQVKAPVPTTNPYGEIDKADLEMTSCDFEKDANAEILFDQGTVYFDSRFDVVMDRHVRIKIFNDKGKGAADIKLVYFAGIRLEYVTGVQAETINLNKGVIAFTKVDKKLIYTQSVDRLRDMTSFSFPDVRPGSVIEFKYTLTSESIGNFPNWYFQSNFPTRYSELNTTIPSELYYKNLEMIHQPYVKNTENIKALANVPSLTNEPYMSSIRDNAERLLFQLKSISTVRLIENFSDTWEKVGENLLDDYSFGGQFKKKLSQEDAVSYNAKRLVSDDKKIAYIFNTVRDTMKWNQEDVQYTNEGTSDAWDKKTGNSTEINLILYHLLQKSGVKAYPMLVSTRSNGKINPAYPNSYQFNRTVVYIPIDSVNYYLLDATDKYNQYNEAPAELLNGFGFSIDKESKKYETVFLEKVTPVKQSILINADISPGGKITGTAQVNSYSYNKIDAVKRYKTDGEQKYIDYLRDNDNNLKIATIKFDNMGIDSLPLTQHINFNIDLSGSDDNYIYFNPNLFMGLRSNEFLSARRFTDIDFGYRKSYSLNGTFKIPGGYKTDAIPKSVSMTMSDNSIFFRRIIAEQDGAIVVRYTIDYRKALFFKEDYPEFYAFFKKMHELLNEQIVLKKI